MKRKVTTTRKPGPIKTLDRYAERTLEQCAEMWQAAEGLDTAVRDNVATGLAYLVWSAYDSVSASKGIGFSADDYSASCAFVSGATANWFRQLGFAEWFCIGAGELFHNQRPRLRAEMPVVFRNGKRAPRRKRRRIRKPPEAA